MADCAIETVTDENLPRQGRAAGTGSARSMGTIFELLDERAV
jgi:hypothetical protein